MTEMDYLPGAMGAASRNFDGRVVVITGAGSSGAGIGNGRAAAVLLAEAGARLTLVDRNADSAEETLAMVNDAGGEAIVVAADVSEASDCQRVAKATLSQFGSIYGLVNNVGIGGAVGTAIDVDPDDWDRSMQINVKSMVLMAKYCVPPMIEAGSGSVVNMSSAAGLQGGQATLLYPTAKAAILGMTRAMASHHGPSGVRVNAIAPGLAYTPMVAGRMSPEVRERRRRASLLGTEGSGWDIGAAIRFLLSDEARWITGITLSVDAGITAGVRSTPPLSGKRNES